MSGTDYLLDTNVVLGCLGGHARICAFIAEQEAVGSSFAVSVITRMELLSFPNITGEEEANIQDLLSRVDVLPVTDAVERHAISLRRQTRVKLPDALIVATALEAGCTLLTCDEALVHLGGPSISIVNPSV